MNLHNKIYLEAKKIEERYKKKEEINQSDLNDLKIQIENKKKLCSSIKNIIEHDYDDDEKKIILKYLLETIKILTNKRNNETLLGELMVSLDLLDKATQIIPDNVDLLLRTLGTDKSNFFTSLINNLSQNIKLKSTPKQLIYEYDNSDCNIKEVD